MLQLIDSNLCSSKPEPIVDAETSSAQANLSHNSFDAAVLEAEIAECISTLLSEKPNEADLTNAQPEVCLYARGQPLRLTFLHSSPP